MLVMHLGDRPTLEGVRVDRERAIREYDGGQHGSIGKTWPCR